MGIWENTTPVQDAQVVETPTAKAEAVATAVAGPETSQEAKVFKGLPVRSTGDRIWLLKGGKKYWVTNKETYEKLGFKFGDEREIDFETLQSLVEGEPLR